MHAYTRMGFSSLLEDLKNHTRCPNLTEFKGRTCPNVPTNSSDDELMNMAMAFTVVLMAFLGCTLFGAGLMRLFVGRYTLSLRLLFGRYNLYPIIRILLHSTLVLFLPLLSYVFSHTKSQQCKETELLLIIMWMLLIELIRKKVQVMVLPADGSSFSRGIGRFTLTDYSDEVTRLLWIGYVIYSNVPGFQKSADWLLAMFVILWSLSLAKLVQGVVATWLASRCWLTAKNPLLIAGYMQHVLDDHDSAASAAIDDIMTNCKYAVMGEETLVLHEEERQTREKALLITTHGYGYGVGCRRIPCHPNEHMKQHASYCDQNEQKHIHLLIDPEKIEPEKTNTIIDDPKPKMDRLVTVGHIWKLASKKQEPFNERRRRQYLENLCLSFSLFKMLRRRFEHYPTVEVGTIMARKLMLEGLLTLEDPDEQAHRPFHVLQLELEFLENYYQNAAPVVMSQPILFFSNIALSIIFVLIYLAAVLVILIVKYQAAGTSLYCLATIWASESKIFSAFLYFIITMFLVVTLIAIEATDFWTIYVFSNWNTVRLLCSYENCGQLRKRIYYRLISARFWVLRVVQCLAKFFLRRRDTDIKISQVSIVKACGPLDKFSARASQVTLAAKAKAEIVKSLKSIDQNTGYVSLPHMISGLGSCGETSAEIVMAFHLATELLAFVPDVNCQDDDQQALATALSRYCMYLVAHSPDLLPDDETWVSDRYEDMRSCLEHVSEQCCGKMMCTPNHRCRKIIVDKICSNETDLKDPTTRAGRELFVKIKQQVEAGTVWKQLAEFWVQMLIYLAPSNDVQGHAKALASSGGDLITCLWAFCTHAGITRQPLEQHTAGDQNA